MTNRQSGLAFRREALRSLKNGIKAAEPRITAALAADLGKSGFESYATEIGFIYEEINYVLRRLKSWMRPRRVSSPMVQLFSRSRIHPVPLGRVLIIAPWNYPFQLQIAPLVAAIAGGNRAILKPSELTPAVAEAIEELITATFDSGYVSVIQGEGERVVPPLIERGDLNHIFFTGSSSVGARIAAAAAARHIPTTLELGGKSPAIVHHDADLAAAAKRILHGKVLNAGQTCVAPDYLLVHSAVKEKFLRLLPGILEEFFPNGALASPDYGSIVSPRHYRRLAQMLTSGSVVAGGELDSDKLRIAPTVIDNPDPGSPLLTEEIFGPLLPVLTYETLDELTATLAEHSHPLALYLFTRDRELEEYIVEHIPFGGGCVNDTLMQLVNPALPFGGVMSSGSGTYHGRAGFRAMTHEKSIVRSPTWFDLKLKYPPYSEGALKILRRVFR